MYCRKQYENVFSSVTCCLVQWDRFLSKAVFSYWKKFDFDIMYCRQQCESVYCSVISVMFREMDFFFFFKKTVFFSVDKNLVLTNCNLGNSVRMFPVWLYTNTSETRIQKTLYLRFLNERSFFSDKRVCRQHLERACKFVLRKTSFWQNVMQATAWKCTQFTDMHLIRGDGICKGQYFLAEKSFFLTKLIAGDSLKMFAVLAYQWYNKMEFLNISLFSLEEA